MGLLNNFTKKINKERSNENKSSCKESDIKNSARKLKDADLHHKDFKILHDVEIYNKQAIDIINKDMELARQEGQFALWYPMHIDFLSYCNLKSVCSYFKKQGCRVMIQGDQNHILESESEYVMPKGLVSIYFDVDRYKEDDK